MQAHICMVQVLVTGVAAFLLEGELFAPWQYVGTIALLSGLMLVLFSSYMVNQIVHNNSMQIICIFLRVKRACTCTCLK